jgi:hypothetical protein
MKSSKKFLFYVVVGGFLVFFSLIVGVFMRDWHEGYKYERKIIEGQEQYEQIVADYKKELREDIYGGETPEETLKMFVEALRQEDVELASKYFFVDASGDRSKWVKGLSKAKEEGRINQIADAIESAVPFQSPYEGRYQFVVKDENEQVINTVFLVFNKEAQIWKIERL